ncbi:MAG TPA: hypothetical protein VKO87_11000 [Gemmatimonadaceae bacterium]|nr:hypothetical protein [Gemmatimonadaceae bacterium]
MMDVVIGVAFMAVLFAMFGAIKYRGCTGHCAGCTGACGRNTEGDHHVG